MQVVVSEFMDESALSTFEGVASVLYDPSLVDNRAALLAQLQDAQAIIVRNRTRVDEEMLAAAPHLVVVGRLGVGLDNIDLEACGARGIEVCPATGANTLSVAEYVIAAAMSLVRKSFDSKAVMIAGNWPRGLLGNGGEVSGRLMGLVGFGSIAQEVATRAGALGMRVAAYDPYLPADHAAWKGVHSSDFDTLLAEADVLSLHVPLTDATRGMLDRGALERMKPGAVLINTARGGIIDEAALVEALKSGKLGGAAIDVFETEPLTADAGAIFDGCPNLILTPHIAGITGEGNLRVSHLTVRNVLRALERK